MHKTVSKLLKTLKKLYQVWGVPLSPSGFATAVTLPSTDCIMTLLLLLLLLVLMMMMMTR